MAPSLLFPLIWLLVASALGCGTSARDTRADATPPDDPLVAVHGEFLADGSCRATVGGTPLFTAHDVPHSTLDAGAAADIAPAGYALHQIECALPDDDQAPGGGPGNARPDAPSVLVTVYTREGAPIRTGRYAVRPGIADATDTVATATRAGVAVFGAPNHGGASGVSGAGVRYLEGRAGTLDITAVDGGRIAARFEVRAGRAWSM